MANETQPPKRKFNLSTLLEAGARNIAGAILGDPDAEDALKKLAAEVKEDIRGGVRALNDRANGVVEVQAEEAITEPAPAGESEKR